VLSPSQSPEPARLPADPWIPPPASEWPVRWRRLGISLAVALLLHAVVAVILVLAWRQFVPPYPAGPVIVELAPPAAPPSAEPAEPTFATVAADAGRSERVERADIDHPFAELPARGEAGAAGSESTFAARGGEASSSAANAAAHPTDAKTASREGEALPAPGVQAPGAQAPGAQAPGTQVGGAPIDTRFAPSFRPPGRKPARTLARTPSPQASPRRLSTLPGNTAINAIGARVEDRVRAAIARANASGNGARNAVGNTMPINGGNAAAGGAESVVNAIGMAVPVHPTASPPANGVAGPGGMAPMAGRAPGAAGALNGGAVNGTGLGRVATRAGTIGGAAKNVPGALNGTDFRPRHP
jgi:hypothetical protein